MLCDHYRAYEYFTEAVLNPTGFVAKKCNNWDQFKINHCDKETVPMGNLTTNLTGNFYLDTNKQKPYSKNVTSGFSVSKLLKV